jgi:hypothetical protein
MVLAAVKVDHRDTLLVAAADHQMADVETSSCLLMEAEEGLRPFLLAKDCIEEDPKEVHLMWLAL